MPQLGNHTLSHRVLNKKIILAPENKDPYCLWRKQPFSLPPPTTTFAGSGHAIFCRFSFAAEAEEWMEGDCHGPRPSVPPLPSAYFLSHPPPFSWSHLDGWTCFLSGGNSTQTAASSSCASTSILIEWSEPRAWTWAWETSRPSLPSSVPGCLNLLEGERCLFSTSKSPPSFLFFFFFFP